MSCEAERAEVEAQEIAVATLQDAVQAGEASPALMAKLDAANKRLKNAKKSLADCEAHAPPTPAAPVQHELSALASLDVSGVEIFRELKGLVEADPNNVPDVSNGRLTTDNRYLLSVPDVPTVRLADSPAWTWLRVDLRDWTYLITLNPHLTHGRRVLHRFGPNVDLQSSIAPSGTRWNLVRDPATETLRISNGDTHALAHAGDGAVITNDFGSKWKWSTQTPQPFAGPPEAPVRVEAFWWGFHFKIPESQIAAWAAVGITAGTVLASIAAVTGPAAVFVAAAGAAIAAQFEAIQKVDQGYGVYFSMTWFVPAVFVPTPIPEDEQ